MISSGIKRGLAVSAVSALAVAGLPLLASSASATPAASDLGDNVVSLYNPQVTPISTKNDGQNTTVSLVAGGGANVTAVSFQYDNDATVAVNWVDVPGGPVARGADGTFNLDWAIGATTVVDQIRAVGNVGTDSQDVTYDNTANTVELSTEGALGVFQSPYAGGDAADDAENGEYVGVTGTTSDTATPAVEARSHFSDTDTDGIGPDTDTDIANPGDDMQGAIVDADSNPATPQSFSSVLNIDGYPYSGGTEANNLVIGAIATSDDAEASTLYVQTIASISATPASREIPAGGTAPVVLKVIDQNGKPVAHAQVGEFTDNAAPAPDTNTILGYTNGLGEFTIADASNGSHTYYVNTTNENDYEPAVDKATTATVTEYTQTLGSVTIDNERSRTKFDLDELSDNDDFTVVTKDQRGNPYNENLAGADVEYRYIIDSDTVGQATVTSPWIAGETDANGEFKVPGLTDADYEAWDSTPAVDELPAGTYTLEARRPNVGGVGLTNATPVTFSADESEISYTEGAEANAPVEGSITVNGKLALPDGTGLGGRKITVTYTPGTDSRLAPTASQPAGVTVVGNTATLVTAADGTFAVKVEDPAGPVVVPDAPENGTFTATATGEDASDPTSLQGNLGPDDSVVPNDPANASQSLLIHFAAQAAVDSITVDTQNLYGNAGPGRPVDLDITVKDAAGNALTDYPVKVTVDKGFVSPNAETVDELTLAAGHDATGDLWGFFKDLGSDEDVSTGDEPAGPAVAQAGAVVAMERSADFDDNGMSTMTVTVTAGGKTVTKTITFDDRNPVNVGSVNLDRAAGEPAGDVTVPGEVDFNLFVKDQFGNLVGEQFTRISDDSTVADFRTDGNFGTTESDFLNSGADITAFSDAPTVQTLTATIQGAEHNTVSPTDDPIQSFENAAGNSDPINWVAAPAPGKVAAELTLKGHNEDKGATDVLFANADSQTHGATVKLFKRVSGAWKLIGTGTMNKYGNHFFSVADKNGDKNTIYKAVVSATARTFKGMGKKTLP